VSQYARADYQPALRMDDITCSMSRRTNCWDNPLAESFFGMLITELIYPRIFSTKEMARIAIAEWVEVFYNRQRIQSTKRNAPPVSFEFEEDYWSTLDRPTAA
jgi:putative transposase